MTAVVSHAAPVKENNTGVEFARSYCYGPETETLSLIGVGSRRKKVLGLTAIDAYALGFYLNTKAARVAVTGTSKPGKELCQEVLTAPVQKTIFIVVTSKLVNRDRFLSALKESLQPICAKIGAAQSLAEFTNLFNGVDFRKGLELAFMSTKRGSLVAKIDNKNVGEVSNPAFTQAFFSLYLSDHAVSEDARKSISEGLVRILQH